MKKNRQYLIIVYAITTYFNVTNYNKQSVIQKTFFDRIKMTSK